MSGLGAGDLARLGVVAEAAARAGGRVVADHFGGLTGGVEAKAPGDYVSEVDLASEETIRAALERDAPGIDFFGEEGGGSRGDLGWVVDPLDGTANFLHGFPIVGVSVALVEAGRPVAGAVHAPMLGETYTAVAGGGAFRDGRPIRVAERPPASAICNTGFPFKRKHRLDDYRRVFEGAFLALEDLRRAGAASLDLAWTAAGVFDGFFEIGLGAWDVAAGALLVLEAGGVVTDWAGDGAAWLSSGDILAAPPAVHHVLLDLAKGVSILTAPTFSLVTADAVREILAIDLAAAKELVSSVYVQAAGGGIVNPPSLFLRPDAGRPERFIALPAALREPARAVGLKWIGSFPGNVDQGLPRASAVVVLNDPDTGVPVACLEGAVISATRTALSAVVGAEALVTRPDEVGRLAVIGAGVIARRTVEALVACGWRPDSVAVFDLRTDRAAALAGELTGSGLDARAVATATEAVDGADLVVLATTATSPWLDHPALTRPGVTVLHLSLRDLTAATMAAADHVVDDPTHAAREGTSLELAIRHAGLDPAAVVPIGALLSGAAKRNPDRAVIYSPFGLGSLDVALADLVLTRARERGLTVEVPGFFGSAA